MRNDEIKGMLEKSNYENPIIIRTKDGFTKFWKVNAIHFFSWGKNWNDKVPTIIDIESAVAVISKSKLVMAFYER